MLALLAPIIIKFLGNEVLTAILGFIQAELHDRGLLQQGQERQAAAETAKAEQTEEAIAQAFANAPKTKDEALKRLEDGKA